MTQLPRNPFEHEKPRYIKTVRVQKLFGEFDYELDFNAGDPRLAIIAGSNGSGKTTVLRLINSALTRRPGRGKDVVFNTSFEVFELALSTGLSVGFQRKSRTLTGPFEYFVRLSRPRQTRTLQYDSSYRNALFPMNEAFEFLPSSSEEASELEEIKGLLARYAPFIIYLPTDRDTRATRPDGSRRNSLNSEASSPGGLTNSVQLFTNRLQLRARRESNEAEAAAFDVLARTVTRALKENTEPRSKLELLKQFEQQLGRIQLYSRSGLTAKLDSTKLMQQLKSAPDDKFDPIASVLESYLASQNARLDSVKDSQELMGQLIQSLNTFLKPKVAHLDLLQGLRIIKSDEQLQLSALSSGERQLLLMFTRSVGLLQIGSVVLIDEPELSLNADWTRILLRHLLLPILTRETQFVMATHSIEIASKYYESVIQLR